MTQWMESFRDWLSGEPKQRDDPIGDVARDVLADKNFPNGRMGVERIYRYCWREGACDSFMQAFRAAWLEWRHTPGGRAAFAELKARKRIGMSSLRRRIERNQRAFMREWGRPALESNLRMTATLRALVLERDGFRCRRCGATSNDERLTVDHVMPVIRGGETTIDNLQTLCHPCNAGKGDRLPTAHDLAVPPVDPWGRRT